MTPPSSPTWYLIQIYCLWRERIHYPTLKIISEMCNPPAIFSIIFRCLTSLYNSANLEEIFQPTVLYSGWSWGHLLNIKLPIDCLITEKYTYFVMHKFDSSEEIFWQLKDYTCDFLIVIFSINFNQMELWDRRWWYCYLPWHIYPYISTHKGEV